MVQINIISLYHDKNSNKGCKKKTNDTVAAKSYALYSCHYLFIKISFAAWFMCSDKNPEQLLSGNQ